MLKYVDNKTIHGQPYMLEQIYVDNHFTIYAGSHEMLEQRTLPQYGLND